jgi:hypothetical protein
MIHHPPIMILDCFVILYDHLVKIKRGLMFFYLVFSMNDVFLPQDLVHFVMLITEMFHRHVMLTLKSICFLFNKKIHTSHKPQMSTSQNGFRLHKIYLLMLISMCIPVCAEPTDNLQPPVLNTSFDKFLNGNNNSLHVL